MAVLALTLLLWFPATADAHAQLKSSSPAAGELLPVAPTSVRLEFTEIPQLAFTTVTMVGPTEAVVQLGQVHPASESAHAVVVDINEKLVGGKYTVFWQMVGDDGHPVRGQFEFSVAGSRADTAIVLKRKQPPRADAVAAVAEGAPMSVNAPGYIAVRWLQYVFMLLVIGVVGFRQFVLPGFAREGSRDISLARATAKRKAMYGGWLAAMGLAIASVCRVLAQSLATFPTTGGIAGRDLLATMTDSYWGLGWALQLVAAVAAAAGFAMEYRHAHNTRATRTTRSAGWWRLAMGAALVIAGSAALGGHAVAEPDLRFMVLATVTDGLHVLAAAGWLGTLAMVLMAGVPSVLSLPELERGEAMARLLTAFSPVALRCAALTVVTGSVVAWIHVGTVHSLLTSDYGRVLVVKLAVLCGVVLLGALNWLRLSPTIKVASVAPQTQRLSISFEVILGAVVLLVTAVLVALPTPMAGLR